MATLLAFHAHPDDKVLLTGGTLRLVRLIHLLRIPLRYDERELAKAYSPGKAITHRIDVRRYAGQKQRALAAHHSTG
ncbi:hypothetical protein ABZ912_14685 [Nonomuraea angiospora]|uniref:hypothetical protein n=1 Tax=Nonomuraea angiospora TaxID=46172 RepID=UPI0034039E8C